LGAFLPSLGQFVAENWVKPLLPSAFSSSSAVDPPLGRQIMIIVNKAVKE